MTEKDPPPGMDDASEPSLDRKFLESLVCPITHGPLAYDRGAQELLSMKARLAFPIREGVPILLESEARPLRDEEVRP